MPDWKNAYTIQTLRKLNCWKAMCYFYKSGYFQSLNVLIILFLGLGILNGNWPFSTCFCQVDFNFYRSRCFLVSLFSPKHEAVTNTYKSMFTFAFHLCCTLQCFIALNSHPGLSFLNLICIQLSWYKGILLSPWKSSLLLKRYSLAVRRVEFFQRYITHLYCMK